MDRVRFLEDQVLILLMTRVLMLHIWGILLKHNHKHLRVPICITSHVLLHPPLKVAVEDYMGHHLEEVPVLPVYWLLEVVTRARGVVPRHNTLNTRNMGGKHLI